MSTRRLVIVLSCLLCTVIGTGLEISTQQSHSGPVAERRRPASLQGSPHLLTPLARLLLLLGSGPTEAFNPSSSAAQPRDVAAFATRRSALEVGAAVALTTLLAPHPAAAVDVGIADVINNGKDKGNKEKARKVLTAVSQELKEVLAQNTTFVQNLVDGDYEKGPKLPKPIDKIYFETLQKEADPEFMDGVVAYKEAFRSVKDFVRLAKLTKETVVVKKKNQKGKVISEEKMLYGDTGSGLQTAQEYGERAINEVLGASVALDFAIKNMN